MIVWGRLNNSMRLYIGLLHYPVYNKNDQKIASAITNVDIHDLSRLAKTYGAKRFFIITPLEDQKKLIERIINHWLVGYGASYNRHRKQAMELTAVVQSLEESIREISEIEGETPILIATDAARHDQKNISYTDAIEILDSKRTVLLIFGTGWGLHKEVINKVDVVLKPIEGNTDYNHLSVRTAAGIILDRLAGRSK